MIMKFLHLFAFGSVVTLAVVGCAPSTTFQNVEVAYASADPAHEPPTRLVGSATEVRETDSTELERVHAAYLGEMDLRGLRGQKTSSSGPEDLAGRASLEAAARGATHFVLVAGDAHSESHALSGVVLAPRGGAVAVGSQTDHVVEGRFLIYRVAPDAWSDLRSDLRPTSPL
jgi:hypothetical protein